MNNKQSMLGTKNVNSGINSNASAKVRALSVISPTSPEPPKLQEIQSVKLFPALEQKAQEQKQPNINVLPKVLTQDIPKIDNPQLNPTASVEAKAYPLNVKTVAQENMQANNISVVDSIIQKEKTRKRSQT